MARRLGDADSGSAGASVAGGVIEGRCWDRRRLLNLVIHLIKFRSTSAHFIGLAAELPHEFSIPAPAGSFSGPQQQGHHEDDGQFGGADG